MQPGRQTELPVKLIVRRPFTAGDRKWAKGEEFDWQNHPELTERRVRQLWDQRIVGSPEEAETEVARFAAKQQAELQARDAQARRQRDRAAVARENAKPTPEPTPEPIADEPEDYSGMTAEDLGL